MLLALQGNKLTETIFHHVFVFCVLILLFVCAPYSSVFFLFFNIVFCALFSHSPDCMGLLCYLGKNDTNKDNV